MAKNPLYRNTPRVTGRSLFAWCCGMVLIASMSAQEGPPPPKSGDAPKRMGPPSPGGPGGDRRGDHRFSRQGGGMSPFQSEGFDRLPEAEKSRVRAAMEKAWSSPELQQAIERFMKANDEFRSAMRIALEKVDPEVVSILEKMKPEGGPHDPRGWPKLPPPEDDAFVGAAIRRLEIEVFTFVRPENRERLRAIHGRVMEMPLVVEAIQKLNQAAPSERIEKLRVLREVYRTAIVKEMPPRANEGREGGKTESGRIAE